MEQDFVISFENFGFQYEDFWKAVYRYHDLYGRWPERILADIVDALKKR